VDRTVIGKKIRNLRQQLGISGKLFAEKTGFSPAAISKFERGLLRPTDDFIEKTIRALNLSKEKAHPLKELVALFNSQFKRWSVDSKQLEQNQKFIAQREKNSNTIRSYWNQIIPGLLQTENYMRAVIRSFSNEDEISLEKVITARLKRQRILSQEKRSFVFVLGEGSLRTCIQSREVLFEQLDYLTSIIHSFPSVEIRVLPFSKNLARTPMHHYILYDERTVEIEVNKGQLDLWTEEDVQYHIELMNYLVSLSVPPAKSLDLITEIKNSL